MPGNRTRKSWLSRGAAKSRRSREARRSRGSRTTAAVIALCAVAALTGCSGTDESSSAGGKVVLRYTWWGNPDRAARTQEAVDLFEEKYPDIEVQTSFSGLRRLQAEARHPGGRRRRPRRHAARLPHDRPVRVRWRAARPREAAVRAEYGGHRRADCWPRAWWTASSTRSRRRAAPRPSCTTRSSGRRPESSCPGRAGPGATGPVPCAPSPRRPASPAAPIRDGARTPSRSGCAARASPCTPRTGKLGFTADDLTRWWTFTDQTAPGGRGLAGRADHPARRHGREHPARAWRQGPLRHQLGRAVERLPGPRPDRRHPRADAVGRGRHARPVLQAVDVHGHRGQTPAIPRSPPRLIDFMLNDTGRREDPRRDPGHSRSTSRSARRSRPS